MVKKNPTIFWLESRFHLQVHPPCLRVSVGTQNKIANPATRPARGPYRCPKTPSTKTDTKLDCAFAENAPFNNDPRKSTKKRNILVTRPCNGQADLLTFPEEFMTSDGRCREWTPATHLKNVIKMSPFQAILAFVLALPYTNISS